MLTIVYEANPKPRVTVFFRVSAASVTTQFLAPLLSAALMTRSPWIPMKVGVIIMGMSVLVAFFLPETLNYSVLPEEEMDSSLSSTPRSNSDNQLSLWRTILDNVKDSTAFLSTDIRILLILPAFLTHLLFVNRDILLQYISTRYALSLSQATVLISIRSGLVMLLCLIILPAVNHLFRKCLNFSPQRSDLILSRASLIALALGFFFIALAPSVPLLVTAMVINTFGFGLTLFLRSLLTSLVEAHHVARLNTFIAVFDTTGLMFGSPLLAYLFEKGIELGGLWLGLPFLVCAGVLALIGIILSAISIGRDEIGKGGLERASVVNDDS
jgi:hypothetical protein